MATTGEPFGLFWDSDGGDRTYSADSFERWLSKFFTSGVFNGDLQVSASSGMTLEVSAGYTNANGKVKFWNAPFNVTLDAANSTYPRIDTVVIRRDNVNRQITCEKVTGQYSGDTPQPTAPTRNNEIYELVLAQIYIPAGSTEVIGSNITDTRPDTSLCGYITGTVEELDFSAFTAQFEAYFAEFKSQHEHEWSVWETAQRAAYAAWFATVQAQQVQDKADWDAWYAALQEELHELPPDTAEYLQIEIDEIRQSGTSGSILNITTTESSLEGKTITVTNGTEVRTGVFDENLECVIAGYKGVGEVTISASDGIDTATAVVNIPYFGNYTYNIAFWAATVNIQGDDNLKGATITVKDSDNLTVDTVVLNVVTGQGVFTATKADTYTFNFTYQGTDYSESLVVDQQTTYSLSLSAGFNWQTWVTDGGLDPTDYADLDELLEDETALRRLFTVHASVDTLARAGASADVEKIINNDLCAKWINLRDYALDTLYANEIIAGYMDTADKYGYGEWCLMPQVPAMTGYTAPYGEVIYSSENNPSQTPAYNVFANPNGRWASGGVSVGQYVGYKFTSPICITSFAIKDGNGRFKTFVIRASNDNSTWVEITDEISLSGSGTAMETHAMSKNGQINSNSYLYYEFYCVTADTSSPNNGSIDGLQFYAWQPKGNVPVMTSNTAPYGEASADSVYSSSSNLQPWKTFDGNYSTAWIPENGDSDNYIQYHFANPVVCKKVSAYFMAYTSAGTPDPLTTYIEGSNTGNSGDWTKISSDIVVDSTNVPKTVEYDCSSNSTAYTYLRFHTPGTMVQGNNKSFQINELQFYGRELEGTGGTVDYSEREFATGSTKKWLYDHGVKLVEFTSEAYSTCAAGEANGELFVSQPSASSSNYADHYTTNSIDLTSYSTLRAKAGMKQEPTSSSNYAALGVKSASGNMAPGTGSPDASVNATTLDFPNNVALGITSFSTNEYIHFYMRGNHTVYSTIKELWLE